MPDVHNPEEKDTYGRSLRAHVYNVGKHLVRYLWTIPVVACSEPVNKFETFSF